MNFDVVAGAGDVPNDARERESAQIAAPEPRELRRMRVDARCADVAPISVENRAQLAGELRFEWMIGTGFSHVSSLAGEWRECGIERLRVGFLFCA